MQPSCLALLAALAASSSSAFAMPTLHARMPVAEGFAQASAQALHDQRSHALVYGQPSFADLSDATQPLGLAVPPEQAAPPKEGEPAAPLAIPEPSSWALMFAGLAALGFLVRRRR
jgi:hypothetical protein